MMLGSTEYQRDLGVCAHRLLKATGQLNKVVTKAYQIFAFISQGIKYKSREVMLELYKILNTETEKCWKISADLTASVERE